MVSSAASVLVYRWTLDFRCGLRFLAHRLHGFAVPNILLHVSRPMHMRCTKCANSEIQMTFTCVLFPRTTVT